MSTGLGLGPYGLSVFGQASDDPVSLAPAKIGGARKIDFKTKRYVVADDGGFEAMDETAQRVVLLTALAIGKEGPFITPQDEADMERRVRAALAVMTDARDPDIDLESVDISHDTDGNSFRGVRYKNLRTGTYQYVTPR